MRALVLDASAAIAVLTDEPGATAVRRHLDDRDTVLVPWLFWYEVVNGLARGRQGWPGSRLTAAVHDLEQLGIRTEPPSRAMLLVAIDAVETHRLTAYDAVYLALAESADADLLTADAFLAAAAGDRAILVAPGHRLAEATARYEAGRRDMPDWPSWPGAAAYLAELRREVEREMAMSGKGSGDPRA